MRTGRGLFLGLFYFPECYFRTDGETLASPEDELRLVEGGVGTSAL